MLATTGRPSAFISQTLTLTGVITDPGALASGVASLEIDLVPTGEVSKAWQLTSLANPNDPVTDWSYTIPPDLEGNYQINLRGTDQVGNRNDNISSWWTGWRSAWRAP